MALLEIKFHSNKLERHTSINVIKPNNIKSNNDLQVLYLLHGYSGDYTNWVRYTSIEKYVEGTNLLVVMPSAYNGFYVDHENGEPYFSFLTEELPQFINDTFNITQTKENTFIAGLSMGGYGSLLAGLTYPDKYKKVAAFSSVIDIDYLLERSTGVRKVKMENIFTKSVRDKFNLYTLAKKSLNKIPLYITCGTEDFLFKDNSNYNIYLNEIGYKHTFLTSPGIHSWDYWNEQIVKAIKWFLD